MVSVEVDLRRKLVEANDQLALKTEQLETLRQLARHTTVVEVDHMQIHELEAELDKCRDAKERLAAAEEEHAARADENDKLRRENAKLKSDLAARSTQVLEARKEVGRTRAETEVELLSKQRMIDALQAQLDAGGEATAQEGLQSTVDSLRVVIGRLQEENVAAATQLGAARQQLVEMQTQATESVQRAGEAQARIIELNKELASVRDELLKAKLSAEAEAKDLRGAVDASEGRALEVQKKLAMAERKEEELTQTQSSLATTASATAISYTRRIEALQYEVGEKEKQLHAKDEQYCRLMEAFKRLRNSTTGTSDSEAGVSVMHEGGTKRIAIALPSAVSPPGSCLGAHPRGGQMVRGEGYSTRSGTVTPVTPTRHTWAQEEKGSKNKLPQPLGSVTGFQPATRNGSTRESSGALTPRQASQAMLHNMDELLANLERQKAAIDLGETWARKESLNAELEALRPPQ
mmetsp:Transcript_42571/g.96835  ORF Transcript_42571/g.96835 Transcript_42571/m.96835 type:complete len:464 (+) Transcript_42571:63-1454(+)